MASKAEFRDAPCICEFAVDNSAAGSRLYQLEMPERLHPDRKFLNRPTVVVAKRERFRMLRTSGNIEERGPKT
jgi:hypothetical protein